MILQLLFVSTYCQEQPVPTQLNSLIATTRTKIKLPAGLCQPEPCLHAAGKDVNWARVVLWTTCSMDIADVSALASASGLFSLPMHTHTAYTAAEIVADIGGSGKRVAGLPPSAVPSVCASSNYAGNFSLALQQRHMTAKQPSPRPAFRRNTGVSLPKVMHQKIGTEHFSHQHLCFAITSTASLWHRLQSPHACATPPIQGTTTQRS